MRNLSMFVLSLLTAAACGGSAPPAQAPASPPATVIQGNLKLSQAELDARVARGELKRAELRELSRTELNVPADGPRAAVTGQLGLLYCAPGGASQTAWQDARGAIYIQTTQQTVAPPVNPDGRAVMIPPTRCFDVRYELPAGATVAGTLEVISS